MSESGRVDSTEYKTPLAHLQEFFHSHFIGADLKVPVFLQFGQRSALTVLRSFPAGPPPSPPRQSVPNGSRADDPDTLSANAPDTSPLSNGRKPSADKMKTELTFSARKSSNSEMKGTTCVCSTWILIGKACAHDLLSWVRLFLLIPDASSTKMPLPVAGTPENDTEGKAEQGDKKPTEIEVVFTTAFEEAETPATCMEKVCVVK